MRTLQRWSHLRREKHRLKMARWRLRNRQIREGSEEPVRQEWRGKLAFTITVHNRISGDLHSLDFYISQKRINSFAVCVDGRLWKKQISLSDTFAKIRKAMPRFAAHS